MKKDSRSRFAAGLATPSWHILLVTGAAAQTFVLTSVPVATQSGDRERLHGGFPGGDSRWNGSWGTDSGDYLHSDDEGIRAMSEFIPLDLFARNHHREPSRRHD
ncbi:hypothetical protein [Indioceanicola profundi]|uniref:hypothetical protein n=1 Tax=Indioceanicola profundi TaxID=2220096 RepID=UPI0013C47455|nr:hypothetical protein [Indioceanicola profundi]